MDHLHRSRDQVKSLLALVFPADRGDQTPSYSSGKEKGDPGEQDTVLFFFWLFSFPWQGMQLLLGGGTGVSCPQGASPVLTETSTVPSSQIFILKFKKMVFSMKISCSVSWGPELPSSVVLNLFTAPTDP